MKWNTMTLKEKQDFAQAHVAEKYKGCFPDTQSEDMAISCFMDGLELSVTAPPPASAEEEAARMYPDDPENDDWYTDGQVSAMQQQAHIRCVGMYTDTIDKLKNDVAKLQAENKALIEEIQNWKDELKDQAREHRNNR